MKISAIMIIWMSVLVHAQTIIPERYTLFYDDFESPLSDQWLLDNAQQVRRLAGAGIGSTTGLEADIMAGDGNYIYAEYLTDSLKGTHAYLDFWFNPNNVDIPLTGSIESKSLRIADIFGEDWRRIASIKVYKSSSTQFKGFLEWQDNNGQFQTQDLSEAFDLNNGWQHMTLGYKTDNWISVWVDDVYAHHVEGVQHSSTYGLGINIGQTGWPWVYSTGSLLYDDVSFQIPAYNDTYYVAINGHDENPGSESHPWRSIQKAANMITPGALVYIKAGTYQEMVTLNLGGNDGYPIKMKAYPGHEGQVVMDGTGIDVGEQGLFNIIGQSYVYLSDIVVQNSSWHGIHVDKKWWPENNPEYLKFNNLEIKNTVQAGLNILRTKHTSVTQTHTLDTGVRAAIYFYLCDSVRAENNHTRDSASSGIGVWRSTNIKIASNEIVNACDEIRPDGNTYQECLTISSCDTFEVNNNTIYYTDGVIGYNGGCGLDVKESSRNGKVYKNHIHDVMESPGIYVDAWEAGLDDDNGNPTPTLAYVDVYQNHIHNCGTGISVASEAGGIVENIRIYNNLVYDIKYCGIIVANWVNNGMRKNISIYNNTVFRSIGHGGAGVMVDTDSIDQVTIRNNVTAFSPMWTGQILLLSDKPVITDHNLVENYTKFPDDEAPNSLWADPQFVDSSSIDLRLRSSSPGIDNGISCQDLEFDYDDNIRPLGDGYDMGAFEYIPKPTLTCRVFLQGFYDSTGDSMRTSLNQQGILPNSSPYELDGPTVSSFADSVCDWLYIRILDGQTVMDSISVLLSRNGYICATDGSHDYVNVPDGNYSIQIKHRCHYSITGSAVQFATGDTTRYDFTFTGDHQNSSVELTKNVYGLWCGDINQDQHITTLDYVLWYNATTNSGSSECDLNGDGIVNLNDYIMWFDSASRSGM